MLNYYRSTDRYVLARSNPTGAVSGLSLNVGTNGLLNSGIGLAVKSKGAAYIPPLLNGFVNRLYFDRA